MLRPDPLFRRPLLTAVALGAVAYASGLTGAWLTGAWRVAVTPGPGPLTSVRTVWLPLHDGSPLPPSSSPPPPAAPASRPASASATPETPAPAPATASAPPEPTAIVLPTPPPPPAPAATVTLVIDGTAHTFGSAYFSYAWQRQGGTQVTVRWSGVSSLCVHVTGSDGSQSGTRTDCGVAAFSFTVTAPPGAAVRYSVSVYPG